MFVVQSAAVVRPYHTVSFRRCGSHGITAAVLQGLGCVTDTNGASVCVCVYYNVGVPS